MPAKVESTPALPGLSRVCGKPIIARFDGGQLSSDGGVLALREIETRLGIANRLAACVTDPRAPGRVIHSMADILRFRMLMIAAGHEDANDAASLRHNPAFKLALGRLPDAQLIRGGEAATMRPRREFGRCRGWVPPPTKAVGRRWWRHPPAASFKVGSMGIGEMILPRPQV